MNIGTTTLTVLIMTTGMGIGLHSNGRSEAPVLIDTFVLDAPRPSECGDTCLLCDQDPDRNATWTDTPDGSIDVGEDRGCSEEVNCNDYSCGPDEQQEALAYFEQATVAASLLKTATPAQVLAFLSRNPSTVSLNLERQALQIRGCGDTILAHLPLDEATRLGLESAGVVIDGGQ